ncbi:hypothetical protein AAKU55_003041 [Oxalobacteraceae bacterium GrIS 1.11]
MKIIPSSISDVLVFEPAAFGDAVACFQPLGKGIGVQMGVFA